MKNKFSIKIIAFIAFVLPFAFLLTACGGGELNKFEGISFEDKTIVYDGQEHELLVEGDLPQGTNISYQKQQSNKCRGI